MRCQTGCDKASAEEVVDGAWWIMKTLVDHRLQSQKQQLLWQLIIQRNLGHLLALG